MTKRWIVLSLATIALAVSASAGFACDKHAQAAPAAGTDAAKDVKVAVVKGEANGCDMPCCAHANAAANDKNAALVAENKPCAAHAASDKPCTGHEAKGCPKMAGATAATAANTEPAKELAKAEPAAEPGTNR